MSGRTTRYCASCLTTFFEDPTACTNLSCGEARPASGWGVLLGPGDLLDRHYAVERVLAVGGAGLTYLAREVDADGSPHGPKVAIKVLYTARDTGPFLRRLANEAQILQELAHDHIVECHGFVQRTGQEPYLVTLFEEGGSLRQHVERLGPLPPRVAVGILRQVLLALDVAHQRAVVHRDLKPDNVLLRSQVDLDQVPHVRVADFGIAKVHGGLTDRLTKLGSFVGTPEYAAPEQFEGLQPTPATDLFAAGGLLWFLLTASSPVTFSSRHDLATCYEELLEQVPPRLDGAQHMVKDAETLACLQEVLDHLMAHDAESRWTVHQVLHHLLPLGDPELQAQRAVHSTLEYTDGGAAPRRSAPTFTLGPGEEARPEPPPAIGPPTAARDRDPTDAPPPSRHALPGEPTEEEPTQAPSAVPTLASQTLSPAEEDLTSPPGGRPAPVPAPVVDAPTASGGVGRAAGCLGLSFVGVAASGAAGAVALLLVGGVAAAAFGWFAPTPRTAPVTVGSPPPKEWADAPQMLGRNKAAAKRLEVQAALDRRTEGLGDRCKAHGAVLAEILISPKGAVRYAQVDPEGVDDTARACLERQLADLDLGLKTPRDARVRVALALD